MRMDHELALAHEQGKVQTLRSLCEAALAKASEGFVSTVESVLVRKVFATFDGESTLVGIATNKEELMDYCAWCSDQDILIDRISTETINKETFVDQNIADESERIISDIIHAWHTRPKDATLSSGIKLIMSYFNAASIMIGLDITRKINKHATAGFDEIEEVRDEVEATDRETVGTKILRDRMKDLGELFGSPRNLDSYRKQLVRYKADQKAGYYRDECYVLEAIDGNTRIQFLDERTLIGLLKANLGNPTITFVRKLEEGTKEKWFTCMAPEELCELIALKLALGVRHQAMDVPEISDMEYHMARLATWLQRRTNRPEREGDLHPTEVCLPPHRRVSSMEPDNDPMDESDIAAIGIKSPKGKILVGVKREAVKTEVVEIEREIEVARIAEFTEKTHYKTVREVQGLWKVTGLHDTHWDIEWVSKVTTRRVAEVKRELTGQYRSIKKTITEQIISSNVVDLVVGKEPQKDWDLLVSPKSPSFYPDRRRPAIDGKLQWTYNGPSFVRLVTNNDKVIIPVKADKCLMHDGGLWAKWHADGENGPQPTCPHCHITREMLNEKWFAPKVKVENVYADPSGEGEDIKTTTILLASKDKAWVDAFCSRCKSWEEECSCSKPWLKHKVRYASSDIFMPLLVPEFKRYINKCVWTATFDAPPILEVTMKRGVLRGKDAEEYAKIQADIDQLETLGEDSTELKEELESLDRQAAKSNRRYATLHVFLPMNPSLFTKLIPSGWSDMALRVQLRGKFTDLVRLTKENGGHIMVDTYTEVKDDKGKLLPSWKYIGREWR